MSALVARDFWTKDPVGGPCDDMLLTAWDVLAARGTGVELFRRPRHGHEVFLAAWTGLPACPKTAKGPVGIKLLMRLPVGPLGRASL